MLPEAPPAEPVRIAAPPTLPEDDRVGRFAALIPALSSLGFLGFAVVAGNTVSLALAVGMGVVTVLGAVLVRRGQRRRLQARRDEQRGRYVAHLDAVERRLARRADEQRAALQARHPPPQSAGSAQPWARWPGQPDFLCLRVGTGRVRLRPPPEFERPPPLLAVESDLLTEAEGLVDTYRWLDAVPVTVSLTLHPFLAVAAGWDVVRALVISLLATHRPEDVRLVAAVPDAEARWLARLPHVQVAADPEELLLAAQTAADSDADGRAPHVVVLAAHPLATAAERELASRTSSGRLNVLLVTPADTTMPAVADAVLQAEGGAGSWHLRGDPAPNALVARLDRLSRPEAMRLAGQLAGPHPRQAAQSPPATLAELLSRLPAEALGGIRVPLGWFSDSGGGPVLLDLLEAADGGDGPHGLVVGATGSGKSELLRTLVSALAHTRHPAEVNVVLVDFKGGAAFDDFEVLPHCAGLLTNLSDDPTLPDRAAAALRGELVRRQRVLRDAGVRHFRDCPPSAALPRLVVVIDEYAELMSASEALFDVLVSLARLGRSLGVHLVLASQRLDEGRLRSLEPHLRYRICLRTFTAAESIAALGSGVAAALPAQPGVGYLKRDGPLRKFHVSPVGEPGIAEPDASSGTARRIWLPPLPRRMALGELPAGAATRTPARCLVAFGRWDLPAKQAQPPLHVDLGGPAANVAVVGAPRSGRSTALASFVAALVLAHSAEAVKVYAVALGGGPLAALADLPHLGAVATDSEHARAVVGFVARIVARRRQSGWTSGSRTVLVVDGLATLRDLGEKLETQLARIASDGLGVGVSVAVSAGRWAEIRAPIREAVGMRLELRLHDPTESEVGRVAASQLPRDVPGRVLGPDGIVGQLALPVLAVPDGPARLPAAIAELVAFVARRGERAAPSVPVLPRSLLLDDVGKPGNALGGGRIVLGLAEPDARPAVADLAEDGGLLLVGERRIGRTETLRALLAQLQSSPRVDVWLVDPRGGLADAATDVCRYAGRPAIAGELGRELSDLLRHRLDRPGAPDADEARRLQLLVVDDLDLLSLGLGSGQPIAPVAEFVPHGRDIGFAVVAVRAAAGFGRAAFDPFLQRLMETAEAVLLSADPAEGPLVGGLRGQRLPKGRARWLRRDGELTTVQLVRQPAPIRPSGAAVPHSGDGLLRSVELGCELERKGSAARF